MIINCTKKFIYIKASKVAGTSTEKFLINADFIDKNDEYIFSSTPNNYKFPITHLFDPNKLTASHPHYPHLTLPNAKQYFKITDDYFKIINVRNPWDMVVSLYYWNSYRRKYNMNFSDWVMRKEYEFMAKYYINVNEFDFVIQYENLMDDLDRLMATLKLKISPHTFPNFPTILRGIRPAREYKSYYNEENYTIIYNHFKNIIDSFKYTF